MKSYDAARKYFSFLEFLSWALIVLGLTIALMSYAATSGQPLALTLAATGPGLVLATCGLFGLIYVQTSRASVDSAEYAQQSLKLSRDQFEVSKQLLKLAEARERRSGYEDSTASSELKNISYDTDVAAPKPKPEPIPAPKIAARAEPVLVQPGVYEFGGKQIEERNGMFLVEDVSYTSLNEARFAIEGARLERRRAAIEGS